jgi:phospholipid-binding lipoprotein MlaA
MNTSRKHHHPSRAMLAGFLLLLAGCASVPHADPRDPLETLNRGVARFNDGFDKSLLKPVAASYEHHVPAPVRQGVSNFFGNLGDAWSALNSALQLKAPQAAQSVLRVSVNTVFGIGGLLDIAGEAGIERHKQDFGSTLARWGVPAGPYLVLPLFGPSTMRDTAGLPVDWLVNPVRLVNPVAARNSMYSLDAVDTRALLLPLGAIVDNSALDSYTFVRDAYLQHREAQLSAESDGDPEITE